MSLVTPQSKGAPIDCSELSNNFAFVLDLGNSTGILDCSKISQASLSTCLSANSVITGIQTDITNNATAIGEVAQDLTDAQTALQSSINALTTLINNQNTTIADQATQIATLIAAFNALDSTVASFNSRLLSVEGRLTTLEAAIAAGIIVVWSGLVVDIPSPWQLANGTNGTPDLRDRFIIGAGSTYAVNAIGGSNNHTHTISGTTGGTSLTLNQLPSHNHNFNDPGHYHELTTASGGRFRSSAQSWFNGSDGAEMSQLSPFSMIQTTQIVSNITLQSQGANEAHTHTFSASTAATSNLPPYYALAYIMKV